MWLKVCGVTTEEDALAAARFGADAVGFVFWPGSPRFVHPQRAARIASVLPSDVERVGVFVGGRPDFILKVARSVGLDAIQLHGGESPLFVEQIRAGLEKDAASRAERRRVIKAFGVGPGFRLQDISAFPPDVAVLLDAAHARAADTNHHGLHRDPGIRARFSTRQSATSGQLVPGGTGRTIDWEVAARVAPARRTILAGGLTPENVGQAIRIASPHGVDVASGVERSPGVKDHGRLRRFIDAVRSEGGRSQ